MKDITATGQSCLILSTGTRMNTSSHRTTAHSIFSITAAGILPGRLKKKEPAGAG
ncbi:MAG: hypothetical protein ACOY40_03710 [Bacillota bacterium]